MEKAFYAFGTMNFIRMTASMPESVQADLLRDMQDRCERMDDRLSVFKPDSEVSRLNAAAGKEPVPVGRELFDILRRAKEISAASGGAFDVTIRPAVRLWDIGRADERIPGEAECRAARALVDSGQLILDEGGRTAFLRREGMSVDLGGIAKGYAGDVIRSALAEAGAENALLNFGGTILTLGTRPDGKSWRVGIQNPLAERGVSVGTVRLESGALVTSAVNERFFLRGGVRYHHLLDPRTCMPARSGVLSVTAAGGSAMDLDGYTTAFFVLGAEKGIRLAGRVGLDVLYLAEDGSILATKGFAEGPYKFIPR